MNLPTLNMIGWSILDYELAFDGIRQVNDATAWLQNQPRATSAKTGDYHPGAAFICAIGEGWCGDVIDELIDSLRAIRFPDPKHEERRILMLLHYASQWGPSSDPLADIMAMVPEQFRPAA